MKSVRRTRWGGRGARMALPIAAAVLLLLASATQPASRATSETAGTAGAATTRPASVPGTPGPAPVVASLRPPLASGGPTSSWQSPMHAVTGNDPPPSGFAPPVTYRGGQVMGSTAAGTTIHPIYWAPTGYGYQSGFTATMNNFIADVAAGSGSATNVFGV